MIGATSAHRFTVWVSADSEPVPLAAVDAVDAVEALEGLAEELSARLGVAVIVRVDEPERLTAVSPGGSDA